MLDPLPDQGAVLELLKPILPDLRAIVLSAQKRHKQDPEMNRLARRAPTKASDMVDLMVDEAKKALVGKPDIKFIEPNETWLIYRERLAHRFKKMSEGGTPQNTRTRRSLRVASQRPIPDLEFLRLNVGWCGNLESEIKVLISCSNGLNSVAWCWEAREDGVYSVDGDQLLLFSDLPRYRPPANPFDLRDQEEEPRRRVRPREVPLDPDQARRRVKPAGSDKNPEPDDANVSSRKKNKKSNGK